MVATVQSMTATTVITEAGGGVISVAGPSWNAVVNGVLFDTAATSGVTQLADYVDPQGRFTMHNTLVVNPALPYFRCYFRVNADGTCAHTVFEYGDPWVTVQPANLGAYTAVINNTPGQVAVETISVPVHYWFSRWRWPQSPYPVTVTPATLIASGMLPHYDASVLGVHTKDVSAYTYTPMTFAG